MLTQPAMHPSRQQARRSQQGMPVHVLLLCSVAAVVTCLVWMHTGESKATMLVGVPSAPSDRDHDSQNMFHRIEEMNKKLKAENNRMHNLLRMDENADMHVEAKLEQDADRARKRSHILRREDDKLSQQLQSIMSSSTHGAPERFASAYVPSDTARSSNNGEGVEDAADELLRKEKARADKKLGLVSNTDSERDLARDYLSTTRSEENEDAGSRDSEEATEERTPRERRKLERMEHEKYDADMKMAETDLRNGHAHRAKHEAAHALERHRKMERLRGFEGREEERKPEAWRLLERTVEDDLADKAESERVEDNMQDVVALHRDVESAKHEYEEEKQRTKGEGEAGRLALMLDVPSRDGGFKAEKEITKKLEKELNEKQRAWDRADALEAAKEAAARELRRAEEGSAMRKELRQEEESPARRRGESRAAHRGRGGQEGRSEGGGAGREGARGVHFVPKAYFSRARTTQQLHSPGPAYAKKETAKMELAQPHLSPAEHSARRAGQAAQGMVRRNEREGRAAAGRGQTQLARAIAKAEVPKADSVALFRKDVGIRAQAQQSASKGSVRYTGVAKGVPKEPAQVSNDIVERLLKLAHAGKLRSPDVTSTVLHPISDALASHTAENHALQEQAAQYKAKLLAQKKQQALRGQHALPQLAMAKRGPANPPVYNPSARRAAERDSAAAAVKREEDDAAADREALAVGMQQQMQGQAVPDVVAAAEAARAAAQPQPQPQATPRQVQQAAAPARGAREVLASPRMPRGRKGAGAGGGGGVWGLLAAPFKAVFGDAVRHKVYLPT